MPKEPTYLYADDVPVNRYTDFSYALRRADNPMESDSWREDFARLIEGELDEFYKQHGPVAQLLEGDKDAALKEHPELREWAIDELSDMLWFDTMAAKVSGRTPQEMVTYALTERGIVPNEPIKTFQDIQDAAITHAALIEVHDWSAFFDSKNDRDMKTYTLEERPAFVYDDRTGDVVWRFLDWQTEKVDMDYSLGTHLLALAYVSKVGLDFDLEDLARYNSYKLISRRKFGKAASHLLK